MQVCDQQAAVKKLLMECEPSWTALRKALEEDEGNAFGQWGERQVPERQAPARAEDVVRRHEEAASGLNIADKGVASTTKKIIQTSISSRKKLAGFDDAIQ